MIKTENLIFEYKKYDDEGNVIGTRRAIDEVNLDIKPGQFIAILGHNGSGKSTLAKHMNAILTPNEGVMWVDGKDTRKEENLWDVRQTAGMVFQNPDNQIVSSVVEDDVAFGPENLGVEPAEIRRRVDDALNKVGMYKYKDKGAHMLSGGQKQRIAIAGAVAMRPECIVFDEPTAMLDPAGRDKVMEIIKELNDDGITTILITHFMEEAAEADRIIVLQKGRIEADSSPKELFSDSDLIRRLGLELPPVIELREELGLDRSIDTIDEIAEAVG